MNNRVLKNSIKLFAQRESLLTAILAVVNSNHNSSLGCLNIKNETKFGSIEAKVFFVDLNFSRLLAIAVFVALDPSYWSLATSD